jgi:peptidoglycan/LPS O-acetylase OafA/YrhL
MRQAIGWLSRVSYSIFVVHFSVSLVVNAGVSRWWPEDVFANTLGMLAALGLSIMAGAVLYERVEKPAATGSRWLTWAAVFMASAVLAMAFNGPL